MTTRQAGIVPSIFMTFPLIHSAVRTESSVHEFIDPAFAKTIPKRSFSVIENERVGFGFAKSRSVNSGTHWNFAQSLELGTGDPWNNELEEDQPFLLSYDFCSPLLPCSSYKGSRNTKGKRCGSYCNFLVRHYCTVGMSATAGMPETLETPVAEGKSTTVGAAARADTLDTAGTQHQQQKEL